MENVLKKLHTLLNHNAMNFLVGMTIRKNVSVGLDMNRKMENAKDYAHKIVLFHNGIINVFVGMDIKLQVIHVFQFAQMESYQIAQDTVDQLVHGIIIINKTLRLAFLVLKTLFIMKILTNVFV